MAREVGLAAISLRDLARRVGMQPPSLYSYFGSKHAIYDAMFAEGYRQLAEEAERVERTGDLLADVRAVLGVFFEFGTADPARYQLLFQRTVPGFEPTPEAYAIAVEVLVQLREALAGAGVTDDGDVDLLLALNTGLVDEQIANDPGGDRWGRLLDDAAEMYVRHVRAKRRARTGAAAAKGAPKARPSRAGKTSTRRGR